MAWIEERAGCRFTSEARAVAALDAANAVRGMVAFDDITKGSCEVHVAADSPHALRALLPASIRYVFEGLGLRSALGFIPANNERARALARGLGFVETGRIRDGWDAGVDLVLHELRRERCARWLDKRRAA